jgi:regulator of sigma E protease
MFFLTILSIALLNIIYLTGFFTLSILLNVTETHYFLGYNPRPIKFQVRNVTFNIGFYIPLLSPIYTLTKEGQRMKYPWEFSQHSLLRRFFATLGGAIGLLVAGVVIFIALVYFTTDYIITKEEINKHGIYPSEWALESGFLPGDRIVAVNGKDYQEFNDLINPEVLLAPETSYTVVRDEKELQVTIKGMLDDLNRTRQPFISLYAPFEVSEVIPGSPADQAGVKPGDRITKVDDQPVIKFAEMTDAFKADDDGQVTLLVERKTNDNVKVLTMDVSLDDEKRLGVWPKELIHYTEQKNSLWQAVQKGTVRAFTMVGSNITAFSKVISGNLSPSQSLGGPVRITNNFTTIFWVFTGLFAMGYAFWNLLPLPRSAFWEINPLAYEGITKKKYPYAAFQRSLKLSWVALGAILVWIVTKDMIKLFS